jgi:hypothetical protein
LTGPACQVERNRAEAALGYGLCPSPFEIDDLKRELARLQPGQELVLYYKPFEVVFSGSWETDEDARQTAHQIARDHNCDIDDYPDLRTLSFRKL